MEASNAAQYSRENAAPLFQERTNDCSPAGKNVTGRQTETYPEFSPVNSILNAMLDHNEQRSTAIPPVWSSRRG